ncbi:MAG: hypothetical protein IT368_18700, partial [Candidatus Hydrogenedentes bacterium]|nr:hypothetical protein [Candidatus Hydrogenedentota bacterium]
MPAEPATSTLLRLLRRIDPGAAALVLFWAIAFAALVWLGTYRPFFQTIHANDPVGYYVWARSLIFDGDLQFENEFREMNKHTDTHLVGWADPDAPRTATNHVPNVFAVGSALLWAPFIAAIHPLAPYLGGRQNGYSQPYHMAVFLAISFYGLLGLIFTYAFLRAWFPRGLSAVAAAGGWAGSPVFFYTFPDAAMSHATSFFGVALFLYAWSRARRREGRRAGWGWFLAGLALGLATLVRWQNLTFALIPAIDLLWPIERRRILRLAACAAGTVIGFVPQMIAWQVVYGSPVTMPQGPDFIHWLDPDFGMLLFSRWYGLLTWTPLCGVAMAGLVVCPKEYRRAYLALGIALAAQLYVNACLHEAGWTFGMRRMSNCAPVFAAGLAALLWRLPVRLWISGAVVGGFLFWNFLFVL